ncbi:MAG: hypothetical protein JO266_14755 [Acidobacteria bacterium]|nr:hypothetical protein [Acidobacteriota bacterium]
MSRYASAKAARNVTCISARVESSHEPRASSLVQVTSYAQTAVDYLHGVQPVPAECRDQVSGTF